MQSCKVVKDAFLIQMHSVYCGNFIVCILICFSFSFAPTIGWPKCWSCEWTAQIKGVLSWALSTCPEESAALSSQKGRMIGYKLVIILCLVLILARPRTKHKYVLQLNPICLVHHWNTLVGSAAHLMVITKCDIHRAQSDCHHKFLVIRFLIQFLSFSKSSDS